MQMTDPVTHITLTTTVASGGIVTVIAGALGVDPAALVCAFMGAIVWRGIQPKIAPTFDEIYRAVAWAVASMVLGTLGGMVSEIFITNKFDEITGMPHVALVGLLAFIISVAASPLINQLLKLVKDWKAK
jgi:hypothetical protein